MLAKHLRLPIAALALSAAGAAGIKFYEGEVRNPVGEHVAYLDTGGVPTICSGHTRNVRLGDTATNAVCDKLFLEDVRWAEVAVKRNVTVSVTQGQYNALVSFTFNLGEWNLARSTLLRKFNAGDCFGAAKEFDRWVYDDGVVRAGLVKRRAHERSIFEPGCSPKG